MPDIYNPWSVICYLKDKKVGTYRANTSSNSLIGVLLRKSSMNIKTQFEDLLAGRSIDVPVDMPYQDSYKV